MNIKKTQVFASLAFLFFSASAHAELLQTWRLASTTYEVRGEFTPPPFAQIGKTFYIDYVIDLHARLLPDTGGLFGGAVRSFSVNGIKSATYGYISAGSGFSAINISPSSNRSDGIDFISFNNSSGNASPDVLAALKRFAAFAPTSSTDLRIDFGRNSIMARPSLFAVTLVPEPMSILLMLIGLPLLLLRKYGARSADGLAANARSRRRSAT